MQQRQQEVSNWRQGGSKSGDMRCPPRSDDANVGAVRVAPLQGQVGVLAHAAEQREGPLDLRKSSKWPKDGDKRWSDENEEMEGKEDDGFRVLRPKVHSACEEGNGGLPWSFQPGNKWWATPTKLDRKTAPQPNSSSSAPLSTAPRSVRCKPRVAVAMSNKPWAVW